ncbi:DNA polymerase III subunit delta [Enterococcus sp. JM4C]|uniref:DNA polymerase III subunit delta n=1 Tax=Candidatus Enterococcus huntleyi TaxID=1857217 RepID=UPI00137B46C2|nr:DNA polymerase III subunit delta [Enterococcus sp. JM4C]KAF1296900.1 DNA polymerase III subunit delta [Enterococcus sp. JM4C]
MDVQTAIQTLRQQEFKPVYLVLGTEDFLQRQVRQEFLNKFKVEADDDLNFMNFDMATSSLEEVVGEAETVPFFGDYRLIFVETPYFLTGEKKANSIEQNTDLLIEYLKNPVESTVLVFFANYEKLDERKKVTKQLKKVATLIEAKPLSEQAARRYIQQQVELAGVKIEKDAFDLFLRLTDIDLSKMMRELEKLLLFFDGEKVVTVQTVNALVPKSLEHNIFDMTNYVLKGQADAALRLYDDLHLQGEETIKINAILLSQLRLLLQAKLLMKIGYQQANIAETLNIHSYRVKLAMQQVRSFDLRTMVTLFDELVEMDYQIKSGKMDKELLFQLFVLKTASHLNR